MQGLDGQIEVLLDASCFELVTQHVNTCLLIGKHKHISPVNELCNVTHQPLLFGDVSSHNLNNLHSHTSSQQLLAWLPSARRHILRKQLLKLCLPAEAN